MANEFGSYVELRQGGYYLAGTRIGLDIVYYEFQDGRSAETIFDAYPGAGSLAKIYGAIAFILDHPTEIRTYLDDQNQRFDEIKLRFPMSPGLQEGFERAKEDRAVRKD